MTLYPSWVGFSEAENKVPLPLNSRKAPEANVRSNEESSIQKAGSHGEARGKTAPVQSKYLSVIWQSATFPPDLSTHPKSSCRDDWRNSHSPTSLGIACLLEGCVQHLGREGPFSFLTPTCPACSYPWGSGVHLAALESCCLPWHWKGPYRTSRTMSQQQRLLGTM